MNRRTTPLERATNYIAGLASLAGLVELRRDVVFGSGGGRALRMHIARPRKGDHRPRPAVVYVFGGGWQAGSPDQGTLVITALALRGFAAASIDYRLSAEAIFPAQIHDCKCAVRYLRAQAASLGIDADRIGAVGPSAGGHLAALLGTSRGEPALEGDGGWPGERSDVQAVVDWYGPTDLLEMVTLQGTASSPDTSAAHLLGGPPSLRPELAAAADPIRYVSSRCPPFLICHGTRDTVVPSSQSEKLHAALQDAGVASELILVPGKGHQFNLGWEPMKRSLRFLERNLEPRPV